jgi:hypothetical protein
MSNYIRHIRNYKGNLKWPYNPYMVQNNRNLLYKWTIHINKLQ